MTFPCPFSASPSMQRILPEQRLLEDEQQCKAVLAYLPSDASEFLLCGPGWVGWEA